MKCPRAIKKTVLAAAIAAVLSPAPLYANAYIDQAIGYGAAVWVLDKVFGKEDGKQSPGDGTCMVLADELNSIPMQALMTARHMVIYAANTEPRSREFVQRLMSAVNIKDMSFMDYARSMGKYWALMEKQQAELNKVFDDTAVSDRGLTRPEYLNKVILIVEKPNPNEVRLTFTFQAQLKKTDCCARNTRSVYLSVSTVDYGAFDPVPK